MYIVYMILLHKKCRNILRTNTSLRARPILSLAEVGGRAYIRSRFAARGASAFQLVGVIIKYLIIADQCATYK